MYPQPVPCHQVYSGEIATGSYDLATDFFIPTTYDENILMGNILYEIVCKCSAYEATPLQYPYDPPEDIHGTMDPSASISYTASPATTYNSPLFSSSPSPSQSSASSEPDRVSPKRSSASETSCRKATPEFNLIRNKWSCDKCKRCFRGRWECRRHIKGIGKRKKCLACKSILSGRGDSLRRHFTKYCRGNAGNLRFETAFADFANVADE